MGRAGELETSGSPDDALVSWLREAVAVARNCSGVVSSMVAAIADPKSALHASCVTMRAAPLARSGRGHSAGDIDSADRFALFGALTGLGDQSRSHHVLIVSSALLRDPDDS